MTTQLHSSEIRSSDHEKEQEDRDKSPSNGGVSERVTKKKSDSWVDNLPLIGSFLQQQRELGKEYRMPPLQVEDQNLLYYDVFLLLNLSVSISFWVVHRMNSGFIASSISEGSLLCVLWILSGLYHGSFLHSAVDGHYGSADEERGGPNGAGLLALHTYVTASSLRVLIALVTAVLEHRKVGAAAGEDLMVLEIAFGLVLMSLWRWLHSSYTPRY
jgi:hypothetical protein